MKDYLANRYLAYINMPNLDGTGPRGEGPKTGRGLGNCGKGKAKSVRRGIGRGLGRGQGLGRGWGRGTVADIDDDSAK